MKTILDNWYTLAAALVVAVAGIFQVIDQTTMMILIIVLAVVIPNRRGACRVARRGDG